MTEFATNTEVIGVMRRQSRYRERMAERRLLEPGEIDHQIALDRLHRAPVPVWNSQTLALCGALYHRFVEPSAGSWIPDHAFCDLSRWDFLTFLVQRCSVLLVGSNSPDIVQLENETRSGDIRGWNVPRLYAHSECVTPMVDAILDRRRLRQLDCSTRCTLVQAVPDADGREQTVYYVGIDYRALPDAPWRRGTIYIYSRADLPLDDENVATPASSIDRAIRPLAKLHVDPWDCPILDRMHGVDLLTQFGRQRDTYDGFPWPDDDAIHPNRWKRPIADAVRARLQEDICENHSLENLGRHFGVSPFTLLRLFRAETGLSPHEYRSLQRVSAAKRLLRTGRTVAQTAAETGFCDQSHLCRHFERIVGVPPGRYARQLDSPIDSLAIQPAATGLAVLSPP